MLLRINSTLGIPSQLTSSHHHSLMVWYVHISPLSPASVVTLTNVEGEEKPLQVLWEHPS